MTSTLILIAILAPFLIIALACVLINEAKGWRGYLLALLVIAAMGALYVQILGSINLTQAQSDQIARDFFDMPPAIQPDLPRPHAARDKTTGNGLEIE